MDHSLQDRQVKEMMKQPKAGMQVGIIHLRMVKEGRSLYGMGRFTRPETAAEMVRPLLAEADREMIAVLSLSVKMDPLAIEIAAVGGTDNCQVDIKSIFKHALLSNASRIICFHNHPSGDSSPSEEDRCITKRIREAGELLGISLMDHIIVGDGTYYSFKENGALGPYGKGEI